MVTTVPVSRHRLTVEDFHRLAKAGVIGEDARIELLEGDLMDRAPIGGFDEKPFRNIPTPQPKHESYQQVEFCYEGVASPLRVLAIAIDLARLFQAQ